MRLRYFPGIFDVPDMKSAQAIILTNEGPGADTQTRWQVETPYVLELLSQHVTLRPEALVLDYGCGIGRMSKAMIEASGCRVIGVDISPNMRALAAQHVADDRFLALSPEQFDALVQAGLRVEGAIAIWVLQHCFAPATDIARIQRSLAANGQAFVLNMAQRAVPTIPDAEDAERVFRWAADTIDVAALLRDAFSLTAEGVPDATRTPTMAANGAFWMGLRGKPA